MADTGERKKGETLAHGTSEVGVDAVLNSISDTILQMVLFQVEAKENGTQEGREEGGKPRGRGRGTASTETHSNCLKSPRWFASTWRPC